MATEFLTYKGYPLARSGKIIYFGNAYDPYVVMIRIASMKKVGEIEMADRILLQLQRTDPTLPPNEVIAKNAERKGLGEAMELAAAWLEKANAKAMK